MITLEKKIEFWEPTLQGEESALLQDVLKSGYWNEGEVTQKFEQEIARLLEVKHAVAVTSGTAALFLALKALDIGFGDEVIVPDATFIATANAVAMTGAKPVLVDVEPKRLTLDPSQIEKHLTEKTKAIIPVHLSGRAADMEAIQRIAKTHHLSLIEDAAQAFTSKKGSRCLGTLGAAGCFSFSPNKIISTGQGGAVVTQDSKLFERLKGLKDQGRSKQGTGGADFHPTLGFNFKFTNLQAAVGLAQLKSIEKRTSAMRKNYTLYAQLLQDVPEVSLPGFRLDQGESPQWIDAIVEKRDALMKNLQDQGVNCRPFYHPLHRQPPYQKSDAPFPIATALMPKALWFPSLFTLQEEQIVQVCAKIREFYGKKKNG